MKLRAFLAIVCCLAGLAGCSSQTAPQTKADPQSAAKAPEKLSPLPGMPPVEDPADIYSADHAGNLSPVVRDFPSLVYVPNSGSDTVDIINPATYKIVAHFAVGHQPQHVVPSWDLKRLWVLNDLGDSVTEIDPATGKKGQTLPVEDPYNMYFTPDGKFAIVVAEARKRLDFRDAQTMKLVDSLPVDCAGVDHMDFTADGRYLIASCEFSATLLKVDVANRKVIGTLALEKGGMPQDVKTSPDGKVFYVADMMANGIYLIEPDSFSESALFRPAKVRTASTSAAIRKFFTSRTGAKAALPCSTWQRANQSRSGGFPTVEARTWEEFQPMAKCCGSPAATMPKSMRSTRATAICWRASRWAKARTVSACILSRGAIPSATPASSAKRLCAPRYFEALHI